jgi:AbrB family looped-hinge helix DNA binding protein
MLIYVDKRGRISIPAAVRKELNLHLGSFLEMTIFDGGNLALSPVAVYPTVRLSDKGLAKLEAGRQSGTEQMPDCLRKEMGDAITDPD